GVDPFEIAVGAGGLNDLLDSIDRHRVAGDRESKPFEPVHALDFVETVVDDIRDMRGRPTGLAATHRAVVEHDDVAALTSQEICRGDARDARAYDADAGLDVAVETRSWSGIGGEHP